MRALAPCVPRRSWRWVGGQGNLEQGTAWSEALPMHARPSQAQPPRSWHSLPSACTNSTVCPPFSRQELELALNEITPEGAVAVAACVASKSSLRRLNLRENELEDEGAVIVAKVGGHGGS